jgi:hypothetical protein
VRSDTLQELHPLLQRTRYLLAVLLVLVASAFIAACGGSDDGGGGNGAGAAGTDGKAAQAIPADSLAFVSANIDSGSDAWTKLNEVAGRFPGWAQVQAEFNKELQSQGDDGTTYAKDIQPWLGGEIGVAVTSLDITQPSSPKPVVVAYVESKDDAKAAALVAKADDVTALADYKGYKRWSSGTDSFVAVGENAVLFATSEAALQQAIDIRGGAGQALADSASFKDTLKQLPEDNLAVVYVDGPKLAQLVTLAASAAPLTEGAQQQQLTQALDSLRVLKSIGMSFGADDNGFRFRAATILDEERAKTLGVLQEDFEPTLLDRVPATTLAYVGFHDLGPMLKKTIDGFSGQSPQIAQALTAIEAMTGVSFDGELVPLLSGEHALYVAPGNPGPIPAVGLLLKPSDAAKGAATIKKLTATLSKELGAQGSEGLQIEDIPNGQRFSGPQTQGLSVVWRQAGDVIAFSNDQTAGDEPSASLADSDKWKALKKSAGVSDDVSSLLYVDIPGVLDAVRAAGAGAQLDSDPQVAANLKPLGGLAVWGDTKDGGIATADVYLEVRAAQ